MKRVIRSLLVTTAGALVAGALAASTLEERFEETRPLAAGSSLTLRNTNGKVTIEVWDRDEVRIVADKRVKSRNSEYAREAMAALRIEVSDGAGGLRIETEMPREAEGVWSWLSGRDVNASVSYQLTVPRRVDLDVTTVNGKLAVEGAHGTLKLRSTNGSVSIVDAGGTLDARTTNGGIDATLTEVTAGENLVLTTTNGGIDVALPAGVGFDLSARTTNGSIQTDFPVTVQGSLRRTRLEGPINGGGGRLELRTTNGGVRLRKL